MRKARVAIVLLFAALSGGISGAQSVYTLRPDDPSAVYLTAGEFGARGDGAADDAGALQQAIDRVQETTHQGVVFVPEGRYRLGRTIYVWSGIRLIGYGAKRPVFVLGRNTPGFQEGADRYMLWFADERTPAGQAIADASEFTFYSAVTNIDFELKEGNSAAVAVRFNVAQHGFVSHANFRIGSAHAAIEAVGNQTSDIHIYGGEFGIVTGKTSPAWQFLLMDSSFSGQRIAAIRTHDAGFTLIRDRFADVPVAIQIPEGEVEQLYGRDLQMNGISRAALQLGDVRNLRSEITLENISCADVRRFAEGEEGIEGHDSAWGSSRFYVEEHFALGLAIGPDGREKGIGLRHRERQVKRAPAEVASDVPTLPAMGEWVNVRTLGLQGDGGTDDTEALQRAVYAHPVLYFPSGRYRLRGSVKLRQDSVLIGFSPITTQFTVADWDANFQEDGPAIPLLVAPPGGYTIVTGFGVATANGNPRAAGVEWRAGSRSMLDDVNFIRGHSGTARLAASGSLTSPAPMQLDAQYPSLWVHDGGGGIFRGIWSHAGTAKAGLLVENTSTPGIIYQFSCEHHMSKEVRMEHTAGWKVYDLQTEEEKPEGAEAVALELESSHDLTFANTYMYRISRNVMPMKDAVVAKHCDRVAFENVKVFSQTRLAFDNSVFDEDSGVEVRAHDFTHFELTRDTRQGAPVALPEVFEAGAVLKRVATGFSNADGLTVDNAGNLYFTDAAEHTIYRYSEERQKAEVLAKVEGSPMVLGFVGPSTLLAINNEKSVVRVDTEPGAVTAVSEVAAASAGTVLLLPTGLHNELVQLQWMLEHKGYVYRVGSNTARRSELLPEHRGYFYAPGANVAMMAGGTWRPLLQSSQLEAFTPGERQYLTSEDDARTYEAELGAGEKLSSRLFAERGGTSVVSDIGGNVYLAGNQIYIYNREGRQTGTLEVAERPGSLCFGGSDRRTLFIGARGSLYAIRIRVPGRKPGT